MDESGPPVWVRAPALARGDAVPAGDAVLVPERTAVGLRVRLRGVDEEEAGWGEPRPAESVLPLDHVDAVAQVLATGVDGRRVTRAWGRDYPHLWSTDPPSDVHPVGVHLWFYPMDQARRTLRVERAPLAEALRACVAWFEAQPALPAEAVATLARVRAALDLAADRDG